MDHPELSPKTKNKKQKVKNLKPKIRKLENFTAKINPKAQISENQKIMNFNLKQLPKGFNWACCIVSMNLFYANFFLEFMI